MIRIRQIKVDIDNDNIDFLKNKIFKMLKITTDQLLDIIIIKKSLDARKKNNIFYVYEVDLKILDEEKIIKKNKSNDVLLSPLENYEFCITGEKKLEKSPIIVGAGPAGLFCAYLLAENGYNPIVIERGEKIEDRINTVDEFWSKNNLNVNSNVQFGEGGAGTFSDGKLNTLVKDRRFIGKKVFEIFVENGAPKEIMYENKPHIGTDILRTVVRNIRNKIIDNGGEFYYNACLTDLNINQNKIESIQINNSKVIECDNLVLSIGHSARDTFEMLYNNKLNMEPKSFAVGLRIQHPQKMINESQYGKNTDKLPEASYKLTYKAKDNRGVYSFCMCPGGYVVNASSENGLLAINGMSNYKRDTSNANSAIVVTVSKDDFGSNPLDGIKFQRELEKKAFEKGFGNIPVQLLIDFKNNINSKFFKTVRPVFKGNYSFVNLNEILPKYICNDLKEAFINFGNKINNYDMDDAILAGIESRTSSPVRINRNEFCLSNIDGIYPCGEGAGYAGGITTSAMDGIRVAESIAKIYKPFKE